MKAFVQTRYGAPDVLAPTDVDVPAPGDGEVLVRVRATSVNPHDWHAMRGTPYVIRLTGFGLCAPKHSRPGADVAGTVEAVGPGVARFRPGDEVFGELENGAFAEYACTSADSVALKPARLSFEQAAAVPLAARSALEGLCGQGQLKAGQQVLVNGASGGVGTFAVQIARAFGADVTGVCSARNTDLVRSLGAEHVIDYTRDDFTLSPRRYDLLLDVAGNRRVSRCRRVLTPDGTYVAVGGPDGRWFGPASQHLAAAFWAPLVSQRMCRLGMTRQPDGLAVLTELLEAGSVVPVIDRTFPFRQLPEAVRYLEQGHARGKVVITV